MDDIIWIINIRGFIFPNHTIAREIGWVHLNDLIGLRHTVHVFTPDSILDKQEKELVYKYIKEVHGLRFKRYPNNENPWISNDNLKKIVLNI